MHRDRIIKINPDRINSVEIKKIARVVMNGGVILYPTDTIYGLGCDAFNEKAIRRVFRIKERSPDNPALVLVRNISMVRDLVKSIPPFASLLMKRYWPGPLTLLFHAGVKMSSQILSEDGKIGIRIPQNNFCLKLIAGTGNPLVSTSANISGEPVNPVISVLIKTFTAKVDLIIDAGDLSTVVPSTIVDVTGPIPVIMREGAIPAAEIWRVLRK